MTGVLHHLLAPAIRHYREVEAGLQHLDAVRSRVSTLMEELITRYDKLHFPSRLGLTVSHTLPGGGAARLAWGVLFSPTHIRGRLRAEAKDGVIWIRKLPGDLNQGIIQHYCRDSSKTSTLLALEMRRIFLNRALHQTRSPLLSIMVTLQNLTRPSSTIPPAPPFPTGCRAASLGTVTPGTSGFAWSFSVRLASFEHELTALANTHNANPPDPRLKLYVASDSSPGTKRSFWRYSFLDSRYPALTVQLMRQFRVPKPAQRELTSYDLRRRRLLKLCDLYAKAASSLRKRADDAVAAASVLLKKAEDIPLPDAA